MSDRSDELKESRPPTRKLDARCTPQESLNRFWSKFYSDYPGKVLTVLPENRYAQKKIATTPKGAAQAQRAVRPYEQAREECIRDVKRIIKECRRVNQKYRDPHFDIESDLKKKRRYCLDGLYVGDDLNPKAVKRVTDIFENPQFFIQGPTAGDVVQGNQGDCYLMAALCGLGNMSGLIDKVCVCHDQDVGVYGFVFHRDGEWQQCIVDDQLYLTAPDYDESVIERQLWDTITRQDTEEEYQRIHQTGSRALYFAKCSEPNETWLPLLEKAYAKAHGDYMSIHGGWTGEAIEDLTGGVTSEFYSKDILDKNEFWNNELLKVGKEFLYGCSTGLYADWLEPYRPTTKRQGIHEGHAYSIMDAVEHVVDGKTYRLVKIRNPWGSSGWSGPWSDGSAEWTPQWMERLGHKFGDDGVFWMSYEDLLKKYHRLDRTRIFGPDWRITQQWTSLHVPWSADYHRTRFSLHVTRTTPIVIVLSQLDRSYFRGLEGQYRFKLQFRVQKAGDDEDYIVRSNLDYYKTRSVSTDITLDAGSYFVLVKITADRVDERSIERVISDKVEEERDKLIQVGLSYDIAHAKGVIIETEKEKKEREQGEKAQAAAAREKAKSEAQKAWTKFKKFEYRRQMREKRHDASRRVGEEGDRDHPDGRASRQPESDPSLVGNGIPAVTTAWSEEPGAEETPKESPTDGIGPSLRSDGAVVDDGTSTRLPDSPTGDHPSTPKVQINGVDAVTDVKTLEIRPAPSAPGTKPDETSDETTVAQQDDQPRAELRSKPRWTGSDTSSEFDWQTDLDYNSEGPDDGKGQGAASKSGMEPSGDKPQDENSGAEPWNAVCVVGLRVYSKDTDLSLEIVRPNPYSDDGNQEAGSALDPDDPAKGAVAEKWAKTPLRPTFDDLP